MEADFGGWATKAGLKCSDGLTIMRDAFEHQDKQQVPLVWQHGHSNPENVLGHAILENRSEGVYTRAFFNNTKAGIAAKEFVRHGDIKHLSIFANNLAKKGKNVMHGMIREVSLVMAGANPGAVIDFVALAHGDGTFGEDDEAARIFTEEEIVHSLNSEEEVEDEGDEDLEHADEEATLADVIGTMTEEQRDVMYFMIGNALQEAEAAKHSDENNEGGLAHKEGADDMSRNVFDQDKKSEAAEGHTLSHADVEGIFADAMKCGSLAEAAKKYVDSLEHGIENIDVLFPDAKMATGTIELDKRRTEWVSTVINGTRHTPFSRIKTFVADLTMDEARAKGYIKGDFKEEEWFGVSKRTTAPTTIYKKQKLDRDDLLDITDFDIVAFLKAEMRLMTEEEFARAVLIGDGRSVGADDKIKDPLGASDGIGIRSIINDHELFVTTVLVNVSDANSSYEEVVDVVMDAFEFYKGTGTPTFFTTIPQLNKFLKAKDLNGRRYYKNKQEVADALGVSSIVTVEPMKEIADLIGIIVNLDDYNVGTDRGGELTMFDDFDIDYNQYKYLLETRASGALIKPKTAIVVRTTTAANLVVPQKPTFNATTGVITIPTQTGVVYKDGAGTTLTAGAQAALDPGESVVVVAVPSGATYYFQDNQTDQWTFKRPAA